ncbi:hypothetical protein ACLHDF_02485 [Priestia aryabhattai]|uniref:hypothetical protein n=1 Tax=Priestia megaterium TaxID=1404 RepID=UPI0039B966A6
MDKLKKRICKKEPSLEDCRASNVILNEKSQSLFKGIFPQYAELISENLSFINNEKKLQLANLSKKLGLGDSQIK